MNDANYTVGDVVSLKGVIYIVCKTDAPEYADNVAYARELFHKENQRCVCKRCHEDSFKVGHIEGYEP